MLAVAPAGASAATKIVLHGHPAHQGRQGLPESSSSTSTTSSRHGTTIHVGDKVQFTPIGFHNADLPKKGGAAAPLLASHGPARHGSQ